MSVPEDLLDLYFSELGEVPLLTAEEEKELAQAIEAGREAEERLRAEPGLDEATRAELHASVETGQAAFDRFVSANLRLVVAEASRFGRRSRLGLDELVQEGNIGLIRAVEKFDWRRGFKFSTYATWWIRQALQRGTARTERAIRLPTGVHANLLKVRAAEARLGAELGRPPCLDELADATRMSEDEVRQALSADFAVTSLDKPVSDDNDAAELGALIARAGDAPADEVIDRLYLEDVFDTARRELPERNWYVLQRRYGLNGFPTTTLEKLGQELGVSRETIRKIEQQSLAKLQRALSSAAA